MKPILVTVVPTHYDKGSITLRYENLPAISTCAWSKCEPCYVPCDGVGSMADVGHIQIVPQATLGVHSRQAIRIPQHSVHIWSAYCLLASSCYRLEDSPYNGAPYGLKLRLEFLFFAQECALLIGGEDYDQEWLRFFDQLCTSEGSWVSPELRNDAWDDPVYIPTRLKEHYESAISDKHKSKSRELRSTRFRASTYKGLREGARQQGTKMYLPLHAMQVPQDIWVDLMHDQTVLVKYGLSPDAVPNSERLTEILCCLWYFGQEVGIICEELWN